MSKLYPVFISYRRRDSSGYAGRLYDNLVHKLGEDQVFMDIDIEPGEDFVEVIERAVGSCEVLITVIGPDWLGVDDEQGRRRIDREDDFVRLEVLIALERNIRVIPVLVDNAVMPRPDELPEVLRKLARRNALEISHSRWREGVARLIHTLDNVLKGAKALDALPEVLKATSPLEPPPGDVPPSRVAELGKGKKPASGALFYSKDHEWARVEKDGLVTVGISDHAQQSLGDIVYVELPSKGSSFSPKEAFGSVESVKAVSELYSPLSGTVVEINERMADEPELPNTDPYGEGWMIRLFITDPAEFEGLLTSEEYQQFIEHEME